MQLFNDEASSVEWNGLIETGNFNYGGQLGRSKIAFCTEYNYKDARKAWSSEEFNYPASFAIDSIDTAVSSFTILETDEKVDVVLNGAAFTINADKKQ